MGTSDGYSLTAKVSAKVAKGFNKQEGWILKIHPSLTIEYCRLTAVFTGAPLLTSSRPDYAFQSAGVNPP